MFSIFRDKTRALIAEFNFKLNYEMHFYLIPPLRPENISFFELGKKKHTQE